KPQSRNSHGNRSRRRRRGGEEEDADLSSPSLAPQLPGAQHIALDAETGDTVASVKAKLEAKVGIPPRRQRLLLAGTELADDGRTLADYGIALADDSATIHLVETKMQVFVRMVKAGPGYSQTFSDLESSDTVESFRAKLQARTGVPPEKQRLTLCKDLKDGHTLGGSGVCGESTLQFNPRLGSVSRRGRWSCTCGTRTRCAGSRSSWRRPTGCPWATSKSSAAAGSSRTVSRWHTTASSSPPTRCPSPASGRRVATPRVEVLLVATPPANRPSRSESKLELTSSS
ncbi:uncharacterized protein LOC104582133, partial [Brachypodium distachyon]|uniref:uncharacterized protein LOC104582133 n=1 Tax=Brachypodium distachyon TaxID=15368 RepID=UPI000D0E184F